jgi:hypothetical protein
MFYPFFFLKNTVLFSIILSKSPFFYKKLGFWPFPAILRFFAYFWLIFAAETQYPVISVKM